MNRTSIAVLATSLVALAGLWMLRDEAPRQPPPAAREAPADPAAMPPPVASETPGAVTPSARPLAPASPERTESQIMRQLREVSAAEPEKALALANEGNARFPTGADAPERASFVVRSLSSLGRHDEARAQALLMELRYPDTEWTHDVHRHMLLHPPNDPSERGYGKDAE